MYNFYQQLKTTFISNFMEQFSIETPRIRLLRYTTSDMERVFAQPMEQAREELDIPEADFQRQYQWYQQGYLNGRLPFVMFLMKSPDNGKTLGQCGYHNWVQDHRRAELGYNLCNLENGRRGYMTEALNEVLKYGFGEMNLNRIEAMVAPDNVPSIRTLKKQGFALEGYLRQNYIKDGEISDSLLFSLTHSDYTGKQPALPKD